MITDSLAELVRSGVKEAAALSRIDTSVVPDVHFERPKRRQHGDWSTNLALVLSQGEANPRETAKAVVEAMPPSELVSRVEVAGPGFINFHLSPAWLHDVVRRAADPGSEFGRRRDGHGQSINVEYVSANPTGPINVVSGRHAAVGDATANLLQAVGYEVSREFYVNDAGRQTALFGASLNARYLQARGSEAPLPEDGYQGDYVAVLAREILEEKGDSLLEMPDEERSQALTKLGLERMLERMRMSLEGFGTRFDVWFRESTLRESEAVKEALAALEDKGLIEEREDARWFLSSRFGDDKDRVVVRAGGEPTYLASDIAYLLHKHERGFDRLIYIWGADHHGTVPRLLAAAEALELDRGRVEVLLVQIVTLSAGGKAVRASKRAGVLVELDELVREVGPDAARYMFLTRSIDAPLDFDIELAKEQAPENPVYYVQYAHARISSILRRAGQSSSGAGIEGASLDLLVHTSEDELMRKLASYEEVVPAAAHGRAPQKVARYVEELAASFSSFYRDCKVLSEDEALSGARLALCTATKMVLKDALGLLGVGAPERM